MFGRVLNITSVLEDSWEQIPDINGPVFRHGEVSQFLLSYLYKRSLFHQVAFLCAQLKRQAFF